MTARKRIAREPAGRRPGVADELDRTPASMLELQRSAGNRAATAALLARRTEPSPDYSGGQAGHVPPPEREIPDPASGRSMRRLKVEGLPGFTDWAIVLIPSTPPPIRFAQAAPGSGV
jgi:hypothetical protein